MIISPQTTTMVKKFVSRKYDTKFISLSLKYNIYILKGVTRSVGPYKLGRG